MTRRIVLGLALCALVAPRAGAQTGAADADSARPIGLAEAVRLAQRR